MGFFNQRKPRLRSEQRYSEFEPDEFMGKLEREFWIFHEENPHVYQMMCKKIRRLLKRGFTRYSIHTVIEVMRWHHDLTTTDTEFKLSNNHKPYLARLWMLHHPKYPKFFKLHTLTSTHPELPTDRYGRTESDRRSF